jgi:hypothetical protein
MYFPCNDLGGGTIVLINSFAKRYKLKIRSVNGLIKESLNF